MTYYYGQRLTRKRGDKYVDAILALCDRAIVDSLEVGYQSDKYGATYSSRTEAFFRLMKEVQSIMRDKRYAHEVEWDEED